MTIEEQIAAVPYWYHRIELPNGVVTPGWAPMDATTYHFPDDLTGKRVLDVGAWDGYWSFEALKRGAREVVAIDDFSDVGNFLDLDVFKPWHTFDLCREALDIDPATCRREEMSVYKIGPKVFGKFDLVLAYGLIYHCRYPLFALDRMSTVCDGEIRLESAICDDYSVYNGGAGHGYPGAQVVAEFYPEDQYGQNLTNWWVPTLGCLGLWVRAAGFHNIQGWKLIGPANDAKYLRGYVTGEK